MSGCVRAATPVLSPATRAAASKHRGVLRSLESACGSLLQSPAPPPPLAAAAAPSARCRPHGTQARQPVRTMASFPRSLDSHSAEGQKAIAAAAERQVWEGAGCYAACFAAVGCCDAPPALGQLSTSPHPLPPAATRSQSSLR